MSKKQMSNAAKEALEKMEKVRASVLECDHLTRKVEAIVGDKASVNFYDDWLPRSISVAVFDADPAVVVETVCGPLFQHFGKPWSMSTMDHYKIMYKAKLGVIKDRFVELVVQIISPTGCTFKTVTKEVQEIDCTA